ncbi:MAG: hypothetical protein QXL15_03610 [Candidatus Korarchaeota archaeon]
MPSDDITDLVYVLLETKKKISSILKVPESEFELPLEYNKVQKMMEQELEKINKLMESI